ncbi:ABC transporter permease [Ruminococcaceae bacterium OttesenSCG-928-A16]|nr:ABC transporter permease [Ruminococcaceae bacterium OttesenSCG-928-A16]
MKNPLRENVGGFFARNNVTILFIVLCIGSYIASGTSMSYLLPELFTRFGRNAFLVLSLLVPVVAGLGLNFGIVIGAVAAQISIFLVVLWGFSGFGGLMLCVAICTPLAILFGWLIGKLFNSMKGTEMIGGLVTGYFSDGLYQLLFLVILGGVIPINNPTLMISTGVGVKNTINLKDNLKYALDDVSMLTVIRVAFYVVAAVSVILLIFRIVKKQGLKISSLLKPLVPLAILYGASFIPAAKTFLDTTRLVLVTAVEIAALVTVAYNLYLIIRKKAINKEPGVPKKELARIGLMVALYAVTWIPQMYDAMMAVHLPVLTYLCIGALCLFIPWFMDTKLGQNMRTVGQDRGVAASAGINVDRTRIIAMIISTVLASYGQLISLQNIGTLQTYGSHNQVGLYAIAALLVGGASVNKATTKQAVLGILLFHTLFILAPNAGKALLGNAQIGEYFRVFVAYGVIALALAMHAWNSKGKKRKAPNEVEDGSMAIPFGL